jgi:hypothetical protein
MKLITLLALLALPCSLASGQSGPFAHHVMVGYVANLPKQPLGLFVASFPPENPGFYLEFKGDFSNKDISYYEHLSQETVDSIFRDRNLKSDSDWYSLNAGIAWQLKKNSSLLIGAGFSSENVYLQYYDPTGILGEKHKYWIDDEDNSGYFINVTLGYLFQFQDKYYLRIGADYQPLGLNLGFGYMAF